MNMINKSFNGYNVRDKNGNIKTKKFINTLDYSLDLNKLKEVYEKIIRKKDFSFYINNKEYTQNVINIKFNYAYKEFNKLGKNLYVRTGYKVEKENLIDSIYIKDNILVAIQTNEKVNKPVNQDYLGKYFIYDSGVYKQINNIPVIMDKSMLRNYLYNNGFICDGIKYVRYKRSGGSSRVGKCLFVNEKFAKRMTKWDKCGIDIRDGDEIDLAAWEAYISLPMSSIIDTIEILPENILVIKDYESIFEDEVVAIDIFNGKLRAAQNKSVIKNSIWDGQSLADESLFDKYINKGMLLLRNQFFKTCAFNTKLQLWFKKNKITEISQLNGFTLAKDIKDIKLITTPSSIKYLKFGTVENWLKYIDTTFGIVKYEKPTHFFDGRMVQSHYQLFNTLQLSYSDMEKILKPSLDYITAIRNDPDILRYHIEYPYDEMDITPLTSKNEIIFKLLGINNKFSKTKLYYDFRNDLVKAYIRNLKQGHVLLKGNYSTLFGNGLEMLKASIGIFNGESEIGAGNIMSNNFEFGKIILGSRSPHITMANICLLNNVKNHEIDNYFNLTKEIVCVNAIGENIQQRLNGCDYDSDSILLTDDEILVSNAKKNYDFFKVPTCFVQAKKSKRYYTNEQKADLDIKTSENKIGEIVNLSQQLNSIFWDRVNSGQNINDNKELYYDICKLAVLSGIEIDKAKKEFDINSDIEIKYLRNKYKIEDCEKTIKPMFFKMITLENGYKLSNKVKYRYHKTSMDFLQKIISTYNFRNNRDKKQNFISFIDIIEQPEGFNPSGKTYEKTKRILNIIENSKEAIKNLYFDYDNKTKEEKEIIKDLVAEEKQSCVNYVEKISSNKSVMYLLLKIICSEKYKKISKFMFNILFGTPNKQFFTMILDSKEDIYKLIEVKDGGIKLYNFTFCKQKIK